MSGTIYVRKNDSSVKYLYKIVAQQNTVAGFLQQANTEGASGYYSVGGYSFGLAGLHHIYAKESDSNALYEYVAQTTFNPSTPDMLMSQLNALGVSGYKYTGEYLFLGEPAGTQKSRNLYVRDARQTSRFEWKALSTHGSSSSFVAAANAEGAAGNYYLSTFVFYPNGSDDALSYIERDLYFRSINCAGILCRGDGGL